MWGLPPQLRSSEPARARYAHIVELPDEDALAGGARDECPVGGECQGNDAGSHGHRRCRFLLLGAHVPDADSAVLASGNEQAFGVIAQRNRVLHRLPKEGGDEALVSIE